MSNYLTDFAKKRVEELINKEINKDLKIVIHISSISKGGITKNTKHLPSVELKIEVVDENENAIMVFPPREADLYEKITIMGLNVSIPVRVGEEK